MAKTIQELLQLALLAQTEINNAAASVELAQRKHHELVAEIFSIAHEGQTAPPAAPAATAATAVPAAVDFKEAIEQGVPQSSASAVQVTPSEEQRTPVSSQAAAPAQDEQQLQQQLRHFLGHSSLFARTFSPEVLAGGKGFLKPGYAGLKQYTQDPSMIVPLTLLNNHWPTGFYRDANTSARQFFLACPKGLLVLPALPNNDAMPMVAYHPITENSVWRRLNETPLYDIVKLHEVAEETLIELCLKATTEQPKR